MGSNLTRTNSTASFFSRGADSAPPSRSSSPTPSVNTASSGSTAYTTDAEVVTQPEPVATQDDLNAIHALHAMRRTPSIGSTYTARTATNDETTQSIDKLLGENPILKEALSKVLGQDDAIDNVNLSSYSTEHRKNLLALLQETKELLQEKNKNINNIINSCINISALTVAATAIVAFLGLCVVKSAAVTIASGAGCTTGGTTICALEAKSDTITKYILNSSLSDFQKNARSILDVSAQPTAENAMEIPMQPLANNNSNT